MNADLVIILVFVFGVVVGMSLDIGAWINMAEGRGPKRDE